MIRHDPRQFDLFAPPAPPPAVRSIYPQPAADSDGATIETLGYGKPSDRYSMKPHWIVDLRGDPATGKWASRTAYGYGDGGGSGPFRDAIHDSRDEALEAELRRCIRQAARAIANAGDDKRQLKLWTAIAQWATAANPRPGTLGGPDLVGEFADRLAIERASTARRQAAWAAVHAIKEKAESAMREAGLWAYSGGQDAGLIRNPDAPACGGAAADPEGHALQWPGHWFITGHAPDALRIEVEPRTGQSDSPSILRAVDLLRAATGVDVQLVDETKPAPYSRHGTWTWGKDATPYGQEAGL
ncbi:MAG: hypothetical protein WBL20_17135 [Sphingobium sp.]|uniref:hypothetical protein n=1 Tax=Sphingobium sp. TaxID=1912891 RepID=UPI003BB0ABD6